MTPRLANLIALRDAVKEGRNLCDLQRLAALCDFPNPTEGMPAWRLVFIACNSENMRAMGAALAFHEKVLPGTPWNIWQSGDEYGCNISGLMDTEYASTPAVALFLADMAALIEKEPTP
jgi:hypothetical protein